MAVDLDGNVYVTDVDNARVQAFANNGTFIRQFPVFAGNWGIAVSRSGRLYVSDLNGGVVREYTPTGGLVNTFGSAELSEPVGLAVDSSGKVYVADQGDFQVSVFAEDGTFVRNIGGPGISPGRFQSPQDVAIAPDGTVWVSDHFNNRVQAFQSDGTFIRTFSGSGANAIQYPFGVEVAPSGNVYVGSYYASRVDEFQPDGTFVATLASSGTGDGQTTNPGHIAADCRGNMFLVDRANNRMEKFGDAAAIPPCNGPLAQAPPPAQTQPQPQPQPRPSARRARLLAVGVPRRRCVRIGFLLRVRVIGGSSPSSATLVLLDGRRVRRTVLRRFRVLVPAFRLRPGPHRVRIINGSGAARSTRTLTFRRCVRIVRRPRFTG